MSLTLIKLLLLDVKLLMHKAKLSPQLNQCVRVGKH